MRAGLSPAPFFLYSLPSLSCSLLFLGWRVEKGPKLFLLYVQWHDGGSGQIISTGYTLMMGA
jgi:hypothetical protein